MKLYGSVTSPYVRRIRILLDQQHYEFIHLNIFEQLDREKLQKISPILKIPVLQDEHRTIFDSRVIYNYLTEKLELEPLSWESENNLTIVDALNDSLIQNYLLARSQVVLSMASLYGMAQTQRIESCLQYLDNCVTEQFKDWNYVSISLYSVIDWAKFRELVSFERYVNLEKFWSDNKDRASIQQTNPRAS